MKVVGIDGCTTGWVAVSLLPNQLFEIAILTSIDEILTKYAEFDLLLIDMPIGLPENMDEALQRPEKIARGLLPKKASSVFNTACRQAVYIDDYQVANQMNKDKVGKGLSKQSFYIGKKIREIDLFLEDNPLFKNKLLESHPELCFAMLNHDHKPIYESKKTEAGMAERLQLLRQYDARVEDIASILYENPTYKRMKDDVVDALCLAIVGVLGLKREFKVIPAQPILDRKGLKMQMIMYESLLFNA